MNQPTPPKAPQDASGDAPESKAEQPVSEETQAKPRLDPTRYGDWELNGKCVDF